MAQQNIPSNTNINLSDETLLPRCSQAFLTTLTIEVCDQDLVASTAGGTNYESGNKNWDSDFPVEVHKVNPTTGVEVLLYEGTDYTVNYPDGEIDLTVVTTDIIRVDYTYRPLSDETRGTLLAQSIVEVSNLIRRPIDRHNVPYEYETAICLQFVMNVMKTLLLETRDFLSVSVGGKSISKENVPKTFETIIGVYEEQLMGQVRQLRQWNTTKRIE